MSREPFETMPDVMDAKQLAKALAVPEIKDLLMEAVNEHNRAEQKERC